MPFMVIMLIRMPGLAEILGSHSRDLENNIATLRAMHSEKFNEIKP